MSQIKSILKLEHFKPALKKGRLISRGNKVVLEIESPFNQIILPLEMADVVSLCNGRNTVKQIIEKIYSRQKSVAFKNVCFTVLNLKKQGFLENGDELEDPNFRIFTSRSQAWFESIVFPTKSWTLIKRVVFAKNNVPVFYFICIGVLSSVLSSFSSIKSEVFEAPFLWIQGSFFQGLATFYILASILLNLKTLLKFALLALRTGRVYNINFEVTPIASAFKIDHEGSHLIDRSNERALHHLACATAYVPVATLLSMFPALQDLSSQIYLITLALCMWDLNPFYRSEMNEFFKSIAPFDRDNPWFLVQGGYGVDATDSTFKKVTSHIEYQLIYNLSWSAFAILFGLKLGFETLPYMHYTISSMSLLERVSVIYISYFIGIIIIFSCYHLFQIGYQLVHERLERIKNRLHIIQQTIIPQKINREQLLQNLQTIPVLSWFSEEILAEIVEQSEVLMFKDGMFLFQQGDHPDSLFILTHGNVRIYKTLSGEDRRSKISTLKPISIFGETCLLDHKERQADAISKGTCTVVKIPKQVLNRQFQSSTLSVDFESFRTAIMVDQFFHSAPVFCGLESHAVQFLMSRGVIEEYHDEAVIFHQGDNSHDFYLIIRGSVAIEINNERVNTIPQGGFFGEIGVIASIPRTATVRAHAQTVVLRIEAKSFWEFLTENIEVALMIETVGEIRLQQDIEHYARDENKTSVAS